MAKVWPDKDPNDVLDFGFDWGPLIDDTDDVVATSTAEVLTGGLVVDQHGPVIGTQKTTTWLSGGTVGPASIRLRAVTSEGRTIDQTMILTVAER